MLGSIVLTKVGKQLKHYHLAAGESVLLQGVTLTKTHPIANLNLALGRDPLSRQIWLVATDEPASLQTFRQYSERFQIEEELLDEKSNGFHSNALKSAPLLPFPPRQVLAVATLLLTGKGNSNLSDRILDLRSY
jgi:hypothetical protein